MANDPTNLTKFPVPSSSAYVLERNTQDIDTVVNGGNKLVTTRNGRQIPSLQKVAFDIGAVTFRGNYAGATAYTVYDVVFDAAEVLSSPGAWYIAPAGFTSADIATDVAAGNLVLWQRGNSIDLVLKFDSISSLQGQSFTTGQQVSVAGYHAGSTDGGGIFVWGVGRHNGGTFIDPNRTFPTDWSDQAQLTAWFADSGSDVSGFKRLNSSEGTLWDFGAIANNTSIDHGKIIQAAGNGLDICDTGANATFYQASEAHISSPVKFIGHNVILNQLTYGYHCLRILSADVEIDGVDFLNSQTKSQLSTTLSNRFRGSVQRARASAIYCFPGSHRFILKNSNLNYFVNGVYVEGGERSEWRTNDGSAQSRYTTTSFVLNSLDQETDDYWNGGFIRILTNDGSTSTTRILDYNGTTNTVTFATEQPDITLTGSNEWNYALTLGTTKDHHYENVDVTGCDFGIIGSSVENFKFKGFDSKEIQQTQETNARPHTIYIAGGSNKNITLEDSFTENCPNGPAYKFLFTDGLFIKDIEGRKCRGMLQIEQCRNGSVNGVHLYESGADVDGAANTFNSENVGFYGAENFTADDIVLEMSNDFLQTAADRRPSNIAFYSNSGTGRGDGLVLANSPINTNNVSVNNIKSKIGNGATYSMYNVFASGDGGSYIPENVVIDGVVVNDNGTTNFINPIRCEYANNFTVINIETIGDTGNFWIQYGDNSSNCITSYRKDQPIKVVDTGTDNDFLALTGEKVSSWTPALYGATTAGTVTHTTQLGLEITHGGISTVWFRLAISGTINSTGDMRIGGLNSYSSYFPGTTAGLASSNIVTEAANYTLGTGEIMAIEVVSATNYIRLKTLSNTGVGYVNASEIGSDFSIRAMISYPIL